jgi:hypothetical protein
MASGWESSIGPGSRRCNRDQWFDDDEDDDRDISHYLVIGASIYFG